MHERFTESARRAMALANQEAVRLKHDALTPMHVLLGILSKGGDMATMVLRNLDVQVETLRDELSKSISPGSAGPQLAKLPQGQGTKEVIEFAIDEARKLGHTYIGTEHLLLGLIREGHTGAAQILAKRGLNLERLEQEILTVLRSATDEHHTPPGAGHGSFEWVHQQELAKAFRSPQFWHLLILAVDVANRLGDGELHHHHLLMALLRDEQSPVAKLLKDKGITLELVQRQVAGGKH